MKTHDAFALRDFNVGNFIRDKLIEHSLTADALENLGIDDAAGVEEIERVKVAYLEFAHIILDEIFRICRHRDRLEKYRLRLTRQLSTEKIGQNNRAVELYDKYNSIALDLNKVKDTAHNYAADLEKMKRKYFSKNFAKRLRSARAMLGLTQEQLAMKLGLKTGTYGAYELGLNEPNIATFYQASKELGHPMEWFLETT